ncbi:GNAT family N-acetyltransferase [Actinotalea sp. M2MS4P-6]|uniref:ATP-binding protein n=1 Tax=Actinotalea sp. M2MS4P-6 TaxID=2983762 RepID=UPI0021E4C900|nr:GNAT family N-acetyltransferase [Actinotalea sp. M2MS4P-6]MCV2393557.1 GNAT family N-acetyltransferase [Actinotalea sp. M2MS4P-6]
MPGWRLREFHSDDLDGVLQLWEAVHRDGEAPVYSLAEVLASCRMDQAVVAVAGDEIVGVSVGRAAHEQGWIVFHTTRADWRGKGIGSAMLAAVEKAMAPHGLSKMSVLLNESSERTEPFLSQGYEIRATRRYLERRIPVQREELGALAELGGRVLPRGRWEAVGGMRHEKELIERRLVLPLARPDLAERYGIVPPRAVVLFGPPGTGKTTFAKAIASRLEWSFVEVFPSRLAGDPQGLAGALRTTFDKVAELEHAVVFIDEVEEIAAKRGGEPPSPLQGVTNELLKIIPAFREQSDRLLVVATNFIRALDPAFLRHGRFDYVIPIGLPDADAREAIWRAMVPQAAEGVDLTALVQASQGFSPADIEFAARKASQHALERSLDAGAAESDAGPTTADYLEAIGGTKATVSDEVQREFLEDIESLARL